jgi:multiple sugar transport system permease protein
MVLALAAAVGLNGIRRLRGFFRVGYYLPVVTSIVAVAVVWRFLLQPDTGPINQLLDAVGINGPNWLGSTTFALPSLIVMAAWRNLGYLMVIFLAGLQTVPREMLEAAEVDGAGTWQRFRHVTVPILRPTLLFGAVITAIGYMNFFEEPLVMTDGGPLDATRSVSLYVYDHFGFGNYSYAAATSYVLFVAIVALTAVLFRVLRPRT